MLIRLFAHANWYLTLAQGSFIVNDNCFKIQEKKKKIYPVMSTKGVPSSNKKTAGISLPIQNIKWASSPENLSSGVYYKAGLKLVFSATETS